VVKRRAALASALLALWSIAAPAADRPLTLKQAVELALANADGIVIQRESLAAAEAAALGAQGAYDPRLGVEAGWRESQPPVNSAFSGAPAGRLAPTEELSEARLTLDQLLPTGATLSVRGGGDRYETDGVFGLLSPAYGTQAGVELRQPLLRNRAIDSARFGVRVAATDRERAAADLAREVSDTVAAVEQAYWSLVAARREVGVREEAVRLAGEQLSETEARIETGMAPELEIAQPRAELERRRGELLAASEGLLRAENTLRLLVAGEADTALWGDHLVPDEGEEVRPAPVDVAAAMDRALAARPEIASLAAVVERRRLETLLARDAVRPSLDAVISYDRYGLAGDRNPAGAPAPGGSSDVPPDLEGGLGQSFDLLRDGEFDDKRIALVFTAPLGNREARAGREVAASAQRAAAAELARLRKAIRTEVLDAAAVVETAGQRIAAAGAAREAAEVQLASERDRYGAGMSTNFLVLTRQNDLSRARLDEIAAQTDYRRARTALARVTGVLLAERGIAVDARTDSESAGEREENES
jgi:HAE1 family hydrophobic/amphiphilic exporter-1